MSKNSELGDKNLQPNRRHRSHTNCRRRQGTLDSLGIGRWCPASIRRFYAIDHEERHLKYSGKHTIQEEEWYYWSRLSRSHWRRSVKGTLLRVVMRSQKKVLIYEKLIIIIMKRWKRTIFLRLCTLPSSTWPMHWSDVQWPSLRVNMCE